MWWNGPHWITAEEQWPKWNSNAGIYNHVLLTGIEEQHEPSQPTHQSSTGVHVIIDIHRFSNYKTLLRNTAYVLKFVQSCRKRKCEYNTLR
ncbi:hypothetical protein DPMN_174760 [Dreissena polymorpha]|uniref:Uncharacterized protein n=1 Tax=Dreissena polymorpha TaxID=45954 RepID=A0A9D4E7R5_DREPO|nr:hypothetical protein DPMN_174734 [Dreissena polymorpha]KAH3773400.1 hypothetical protein DPMN_174760 [Dreissena polymorpha]